MGILDEDIERVRAASDLVAIASERLALRKVGRRHVGLCPFHAERTPSFSVNAEENLFYCFGCGAKGDVITFVRETEHLDFAAAVEWLAQRAGITVRYDRARQSSERRRRDRLLEAVAAAVEWYHQRLLSAPDAAPARGYLRARGYDGEVVRRFRLGWAPEDWDALCRALDLPEDVLRDAGLGFRNRRGRLQDVFRARVLFPIFDPRGDAVAFGGRALPGGDGPKYKNSPATPLYDKSEALYGLNWAKAEIVAAGEAVVCEGYTDVIGLAAAGVGRAVATCGTALTERHVAALKGFGRRLVLAFDADAAGEGAVERVYEWEQRHDLDVRVAALPAGTDPADLARTDPAALRAAVEQAPPLLAFRLDRLLRRADVRTPDGQGRAVTEARALLAEHPSDTVRKQYAERVARRLAVADPADLLRAPPVRPRPSRPSRPSRADNLDLMALRLAVHRPEQVADLLDESLLGDATAVAAYRALAGAATLHQALDTAPPDAAGLLQRLAVEEDPDVDALDVVGLLVRRAAARAMADLQRVVAETGSLDAVRQASWVRARVDRLTEAASREALVELLAFLRERAQEGA